jgi:hypothetical protein
MLRSCRGVAGEEEDLRRQRKRMTAMRALRGSPAPSNGSKRRGRPRRRCWTPRRGEAVTVAAVAPELRRRWRSGGDGSGGGVRGERGGVVEEARGNARALPLSPRGSCSVGGAAVSRARRRARVGPGARRHAEGERGRWPGGLGFGALCTQACAQWPFSLFCISFLLFLFCFEIGRPLVHFCKIWKLTQIL